MTNDELVVVFVNVAKATREYLRPMGFRELGGGDGKNVAAICADEFFFMTPPQTRRPVDILLLPDGDLTEGSEQEEALAAQAEGKRKVYAIYHISSTNKTTQKTEMTRLFGASLVPWEEHHDKGCVFDALTELAACRGGNDLERYKKAVARLVACCQGDAGLEAKLELLHLCLTPEGAASAANDALPDSIPPHIRERIPELKLIEKDGRTVGEMISELARPGSDPFDASAGGYVEKLRVIREALLGERGPSEDAPAS